MRILVTGGSGFIGTNLCVRLASLGHDVLSLDNHFRSAAPDAGVTTCEGDIRDPVGVRDLCRGAEVVVHLAAIQGTRNFYEIPDVVLDVNLRGALNVAEACAAEGVRRLVFSSSSEVYGTPQVFPTPETAPLVVPDVLNPRFSYGGSKAAGELIVVNYARRHDFEHTVIRYHNVYGPRMGWDHVIPQFIARLEREEEFTVQGDGTQTRSFCYVDDAIDGTVAAVLEPAAANEIFNIGNPDEEHSINHLIAILEEACGRRIDPVFVPFDGEGTHRRVPDIGRARRLLGFAPNVCLRDGLTITYGWYSEQLRANGGGGPLWQR